MCAQRRFDLAGLDTVSTLFPLIVGAAEELYAAIVETTHAIAGAIHAFPRVFHETVGSQVVTSEIAHRYAGTTDPQLTRNVERLFVATRIDDIGVCPGQRAPNRNGLCTQPVDGREGLVGDGERHGADLRTPVPVMIQHAPFARRE